MTATDFGGGLWDRPVLIAPMAGGPTTAALAAAAAEARAFAFVAGAYKTANQLAADIRAVRDVTSRPFGVNVFVPGRPTTDAGAVTRYLHELKPDAARLGVPLGEARWNDDDWTAKIELLVEAAPAMVSFTFGTPPRDVIDAFRRRGVVVMITVTNPTEADVAARSGADVLCAQGIEAGAHRGTFDDTAPDDELTTLELVTAITARVSVPVVAAGGLATPADVAAALRAGAIGVQGGTAFLRCDEAGTSPVHRAALEDPRYQTTARTRAFTGRRARGLLNDFMRRHPDAPSAFPAIHHATQPLRAAATAVGDAEGVHLWAGTGHRHTRAAPVAAVVEWLAEGMG